MKLIKYPLFALAIIACFGFNTDAASTVNHVETSANKQIIYTFKEVAPNSWYQARKDVQFGKIVNSSFVVATHDTFTYEHDSSKKCATTPDKAAIESCAKLTKSVTYADDTNNLPLVMKNYVAGKITKQNIFVRTDQKAIAEYRVYTYHTNGKIKKYSRYYDGKSLKIDTIVYNKIQIRNINNKGQKTSIYNYESSLLWNEEPVDVATRVIKYSYHNNGKVKQINNYYKSVKYNAYSKKSYVYYDNKGKKTRYIISAHDNNGIITKKNDYHYNKIGQLRSNKYGNAYRITTSYKAGKVDSKKTYQYNAKGKAILQK